MCSQENDWIWHHCVGSVSNFSNGRRTHGFLEVTSSEQKEPVFCSMEPVQPLKAPVIWLMVPIYVQFLWLGEGATADSETVRLWGSCSGFLFVRFVFSSSEELTNHKETASDHPAHLNQVTNPEHR